MANQVIYLDRKFGHIKVSWQIENFCFLKLSEDWKIYSPEFHVRGHQVSKWQMILNPRTDENWAPGLSFALKRLENDGDCQDVVVEFNLQISMGAKGEETQHRKCLGSYFTCNSEFDVDLNDKAGVVICGETLVIDLQLLVHFVNVKEDLVKCSDPGLKALSEDFVRLFEVGEQNDTELVVCYRWIKVHEAILLARNNAFAQLIDSMDPHSREIRSTWFNDYSAVKDTVRFLYSGNLKYVVNNPSISIYEFASDIQVTEIMDYYNPDTLSLLSTIKKEELPFTWAINVSSRSERWFEGPLLIGYSTDTAWRLRLDRKRLVDNVEYTTVFVEVVKGKATNSFCMDFVLKNNNESLAERRFYRQLSDKETLAFDIDKSDALENRFQDGNLNIHGRLQIFTAELNSSVKTRSIAVIKSSNDANYIRLSLDMERLLNSASHSDHNLLWNRGNHFHLHRSILSARAPDFIMAVLNVHETDLPNIEEHILGMFLHFLYCGRFTSTIPSRSDSYALNRVAEEFKVPSLSIVLSRMFGIP